MYKDEDEVLMEALSVPLKGEMILEVVLDDEHSLFVVL